MRFTGSGGKPGECLPPLSSENCGDCTGVWPTSFASSGTGRRPRIDPQVIESGRHRHWGLAGMRERAAAIVGRIDIWSRQSAGTRIDLLVPGRTAFQVPTSVIQTWLECSPRQWKWHEDNCVLAATMSESMRIRVLCVDDHPLMREGIAAIINSQPDMALVAEATNGTKP